MAGGDVREWVDEVTKYTSCGGHLGEVRDGTVYSEWPVLVTGDFA